MTTPNQYPRRRFLQQAILASVAAGGSSVLAACASGGDDSTDTGGATSAENPFGVAADAPLDVVIFKGGYGDDYAKFHEELYKKKFSGAQIKHAGITDIRQQLQPRFNSGNPPDVIDNSGAEQLPLATLADTGQLADLTPLFDAESIDGGKIRDTLNPVATRGRRLRRQDPGPELRPRGLRPLVRQDAVRREGLAAGRELAGLPRPGRGDQGRRDRAHGPPGQVPVLHPAGADGHGRQARRQGGRHRDRQPRAERLEARRRSSWPPRRWLEIKSKGYMLEGTEGLDHIQSQTRWNEGKAAFIPSGSWLENEQKKVAPEGFATTVAPTPLLDGAKLPFQSTRVSAAEAFIVPAKAKNVPGGQEYLRIMLSKEGASKFTELTAAPTVVNGAGEGLEAHPGRGLGQRAGEGRRRQQLELLLLRLVLADAAEDRDGRR